MEVLSIIGKGLLILIGLHLLAYGAALVCSLVLTALVGWPVQTVIAGLLLVAYKTR